GMTLSRRDNTPDNAGLIGFTNLRQSRTSRPMVMEKGRGIFLTDENGREFIEGCSSFYCAALGFSDDDLIDAAIRQMRVLPAYSSGIYRTVPVVLELTEKLAALAPLPNARVALASTGSEANDFLLKFMRFRNATLGERRRTKVIARAGSYHGATMATAALGGFPGTAESFNLPADDVILVSQPDYVNAAQPGETEDEFTARMLAEIEAAILKAGPETVGAMILEPVSYSAGCVIPPRGYMEGLRRLLIAHGALLFDDEVICGFGRTGALFGAETLGIQPDCITIAKALSAAFQPISAVIMNGDFYDVLERGSDEAGVFSHAATYSGHPVAAAVALRMLQLIEERDLIGHVRRVAPRLHRLIGGMAGHPMVFNTRAIGLSGAVQFRPSAEGPGVLGKRLQQAMIDQGLLLRVVRDTVNFAPPLIISESEIDELFRRFRKAVDTVEAAQVASAA
ncbi:MAG: aminotransferase class III-fold pyridoxal phosphate-dependent enzyme, partial [Proteobacteria bacterium]|nr:aminotransferase class III-fold pyridoxal phosphate-dependent enzyme [Pseudomonadota bacterium]